VADRPATGGASTEPGCGDVDRLRLELAARRLDAHLAAVLATTLRLWATHAVTSLCVSAWRSLLRWARSIAVRLAPPGTARRRAVRAVVTSALQARRGAATRPLGTRRYRQYYAHAQPGPSQLRSRAAALSYLEVHPVVSVVVVAARGELTSTLATLDAQIYDRTEVVVVATEAVRCDPAVIVVTAQGTDEELANAGVEAANGEFVVVLGAGDLLAPHALCDLVTALQDGADAAYADEDRYDEDHEHADGHLKPARFGRETLYSYDVVGAPLLVRTTLHKELGGLDATTAPVAAHDFALRLAERTASIAHVAEVLLSRPAEFAPDPFDATAATIPVVTRALSRLGASATVGAGEVLPSVRYTVAPPTPAPSVAIVIPTRDRLDLLRACLDSVERRTTYPCYSIVICDNDSVERETLRWMASTTHAVVHCPGPFNYASIVNRGVAHTDADFVVTLNNDTTIATPDWLERLVGLCALEGVGSVGVKLQYPDGRLQHEGVGIIPMPVHLSRDVNYDEPDRWLTSTRDAAAVTGACQIVRTKAWRDLGGLDERLAVAFNDVDFGMRLCEAGWRVVYTPEVVLGHRESASRGDLHPPADEALLIARWDLLGDYVDPSMQPAIRQYTTRIELDVPAPGR
jgi:O-antigen biosynthesis protein